MAPTGHSTQIVVWDNLSVHKSAAAIGQIAAVGCRVVFLPPYSPDYAPVERAFSKLKTFLRRAGPRTRDALDEAMTDGLATITAHDARAWFASCGYRQAGHPFENRSNGTAGRPGSAITLLPSLAISGPVLRAGPILPTSLHEGLARDGLSRLPIGQNLRTEVRVLPRDHRPVERGLGVGAASGGVEAHRPGDGGDHLSLVIAEDPRHPIDHDLRRRAPPVGDDRCPTRGRLGQH